MFCVCRGNPLHFFILNYQPFALMHVRSPPCRPKGCLSGVAWPPTLSPSLGPCCVLVVFVDDVVADILSSLCSISPPNCARFSFFCLIFNLPFAFYFPLSGGNRDGITSTKRDILWCFNVCKETPCFYKKWTANPLYFCTRAHLPEFRSIGGVHGPRAQKNRRARGKLWSHFTIITYWYLITKTNSSLRNTHNNL